VNLGARTSILCGLAAALLAASAAKPAFAQRAPSGVTPPRMSQGAVLNLSLIEALVAVRQQRLSGVFAFVPEDRTGLAFANYMMYDHKALKRYLKYARKIFDKAGAISHWDKRVMLLLVGMVNQAQRPPGVEAVGKKQVSQISELALVPGVPVEELRTREAVRGAR
jgi:hypothetical protein